MLKFALHTGRRFQVREDGRTCAEPREPSCTRARHNALVVVAALVWLAYPIAAGGGCKKSSDETARPKAESESRASLGHSPALLPSAQPLAVRSAIRSILQDSRGRYWFGSHRDGVARLADQGISYFDVGKGLPGNQVRSIQEAKDGTILLETDNGVARIEGNAAESLSMRAGPTVEEGVWSIHDSDLWFPAARLPGVYRLRGTSMEYLRLPFEDSAAAVEGFTPFVTGIAPGTNTRVWIATYGAVFGYSRDEFTIVDSRDLGPVASEGVLHVRSILEDSQGRLWIGNNGLGVLLLDGSQLIDFSKAMDLVALGSNRDGGASPPGTLEHVFALAEDAAGAIWFGDRDTGVWKFDGESMQNYGLAEGLPSLSVWDIHEDRAGNILVALDDGAVSRFEGGRFEGVFPSEEAKSTASSEDLEP